MSQKSTTTDYSSQTIAWIGFVLLLAVIFSLWQVLTGTVTFGDVNINGVNFAPEMFVPVVAGIVFLLLRWVAHHRPATIPYFIVHKLLSGALLLVVVGAIASWVKPLGIYYAQIGTPIMPFNTMTASVAFWFLLVAIYDIKEHHLSPSATLSKPATSNPKVSTTTMPPPEKTHLTREEVLAALGVSEDSGPHHYEGLDYVLHPRVYHGSPTYEGRWEGDGRPLRVRGRIDMSDDALSPSDDGKSST